MRLIISFLLATSALLLWDTEPVRAAEDRGAISGTLVYEGADVPCDGCMVTLLSNGVQPVASVAVDISGRFAFSNVPPGRYAIHISIDGFEDVKEPVQERD